MRSVISTTVSSAVILGENGFGDMLLITKHGAVKPPGAGSTGVYAPATEPGRIANLGKVFGGVGVDHYTPGGTGGTGIEMAGTQTLLNSGTIGGGYGGYGYYFGTGGTGGVGVHLDGAGRLANNGVIFGGNGNIGQGYRGTGGTGGIGVVLGSSAVATNGGTIKGGHGGIEFNEEAGPYGNSGTGGAGVTLELGATLASHGLIEGGDGGQYAPFGGDRYFYGIGGSGGAAVGAAAGVMINNSGTIVGGNGGGGFAYSQGAGAGVSLSGEGQLTNNNLVMGGAGGFISYNRGSSGADGIVLANRGDLINAGTVVGGAGGGARFGIGGNGGAGVYLNGGTITNTGTIAGGAGAAGYYGSGKMGHAVVFGPLSGTVIKADGAAFVGSFGGFAAGDVIDDRSINAVSLGYTNNTLTLYDAAHIVVDRLAFDGNFTSKDFGLHADGLGGTEVTYADPNFGFKMPIAADTSIFGKEAPTPLRAYNPSVNYIRSPAISAILHISLK